MAKIDSRSLNQSNQVSLNQVSFSLLCTILLPVVILSGTSTSFRNYYCYTHTHIHTLPTSIWCCMYVIDLQLSPWNWITYWGLRPREKRLSLSLVLYLLCCVKMSCRSWQVEIRFCLRRHVTCGNSECDLFSHLAHRPTQQCFVALIHSPVFLQLKTLKASRRTFFFP